MFKSLASLAVPGVLGIGGIVLLVLWVGTRPATPLDARVPGLDGVPPSAAPKAAARPVPGNPVQGAGQPSALPGAWPWFRGLNRDAICDDGIRLARHWPNGGPPRLWMIPLGEGYAAAAVQAGRVYVLDHAADADVLRCLSLDDGREIWRNSYPVEVTPHHGASRTIPAVIGDDVITLGPKCHVACWDAKTGKAHWLIDLVLDHGATVPEWYAGQCPLVDEKTDRLVLAVGGKALLMAVDYKTGEVKWQSPNPRAWTMTHSSIMPMEVGGRRMYVYCGKGGVAGIAADDGSLLWDTSDWKIGTATCPSPVVVGDGRVFFCGGYNAGSLMLQVTEQGGKFTATTLYALSPKVFGSEQQTPVLYDGRLYGVRQKDQQLVCLDLDGKEVWNSGKDKFGSAPYMIAGGLIYAMNDEGVLTLAEATPRAYRPLARAEVIEAGVDSWGPLAMAAGRLIARDATRMVCIDVAEKGL